jgi:uncharacterized membrane protein (UPF0127 family)
MPGAAGLQVINRTRGVVIADQLKVATSFWARTRGLIGRRDLPAGFALVIRPCRGVHALGMRLEIEAGYVDHAGRVLRIVRLKPWRLGPLVWRGAWVIELPAGTAQATGTQIGDQIELVDGDVSDQMRFGHDTQDV